MSSHDDSQKSLKFKFLLNPRQQKVKSLISDLFFQQQTGENKYFPQVVFSVNFPRYILRRFVSENCNS